MGSSYVLRSRMGKGHTKRQRILMNYLLQALIAKLEGEKEVAKANVMVYTRNSTGIGEHPGIVEAIESEIEKLANAEEKIATIHNHFSK